MRVLEGMRSPYLLFRRSKVCSLIPIPWPVWLFTMPFAATILLAEELRTCLSRKRATAGHG